MIRFALDTNVVIALLKTRDSPLGERIRARPVEEFAISSVVLFELYFGAFKSARQAQNLGVVDALGFDVLPLDADDARHAGEIRAVLRTEGAPIGPYDLLIAGQARAKGLTLITANMREFQRVAKLTVEDWS